MGFPLRVIFAITFFSNLINLLARGTFKRDVMFGAQMIINSL
jgi:hypothetical protein